MNYGYARVSTIKQGRGNSLEEQLSELFSSGCDEVIEEKFSGKTNDRPQLKLLLEKLKEHIDGNYMNNKEENLILLCPNCHSLTQTYKGANRNHGRQGRKKYMK